MQLGHTLCAAILSGFTLVSLSTLGSDCPPSGYFGGVSGSSKSIDREYGVISSPFDIGPFVSYSSSVEIFAEEFVADRVNVIFRGDAISGVATDPEIFVLRVTKHEETRPEFLAKVGYNSWVVGGVATSGLYEKTVVIAASTDFFSGTLSMSRNCDSSLDLLKKNILYVLLGVNVSQISINRTEMVNLLPVPFFLGWLIICALFGAIGLLLLWGCQWVGR